MASNLLVIVILVVAAAYGIDVLLVWFDHPPYFACNVLPVWQALSDPWPLLVAVAGVLWWLGSRLRSRGGLLVFLVGLIGGIMPWLLAGLVNPVCP